jgi:hypothetical protein
MSEHTQLFNPQSSSSSSISTLSGESSQPSQPTSQTEILDCTTTAGVLGGGSSSITTHQSTYSSSTAVIPQFSNDIENCLELRVDGAENVFEYHTLDELLDVLLLGTSGNHRASVSSAIQQKCFSESKTLSLHISRVGGPDLLCSVKLKSSSNLFFDSIDDAASYLKELSEETKEDMIIRALQVHTASLHIVA